MRGLPLVAVLAVGLAGCIGQGQDPAPAEPLAPGAAVPAPLAPLAVLPFQGRLAAGAAMEVPAHFRETEPLVAPVWTSGTVLELLELPEDLQVALDWTGPAASIQLMVHAPHAHEGEERGWPEYVTPFSSEPHQCLRVPAADLVEGPWYLMVHSEYGVDVDYTITALVRGGLAEMKGPPHGHALSAEELQKLLYTLVDTNPVTGATRATEPCDDTGA